MAGAAGPCHFESADSDHIGLLSVECCDGILVGVPVSQASCCHEALVVKSVCRVGCVGSVEVVGVVCEGHELNVGALRK